MLVKALPYLKTRHFNYLFCSDHLTDSIKGANTKHVLVFTFLFVSQLNTVVLSTPSSVTKNKHFITLTIGANVKKAIQIVIYKSLQ